MAGEEGVLGRCTSEQKAAKSEESSAKCALGEGTSTQQPMEDELLAEGGIAIKEAGSELLQAEVPADGAYDDDEAEDDYQDDGEYDDEYGYDDSDYEEEEERDYRPKMREVLLRFPEAANLESHELDAAVERIMEQCKPEYDDVAAPGRIRLRQEDVEKTLEQWEEPPHTIIHKWFQLSAELEEEFLALYGKPEEQQVRERFQAKVRTEWIEKGFVEVDEDYYERQNEINEYEQRCMQKFEQEWNQKMHFNTH